MMLWYRTKSICDKATCDLVESTNEPDFEDNDFRWYIVALGGTESSCIGYCKEWEKTPWWMLLRRVKGQNLRRTVLETTYTPACTRTKRRWWYEESPVATRVPTRREEMARVLTAG
jgi:hypothetical protein